jgi:hypothetical protein
MEERYKKFALGAVAITSILVLVTNARTDRKEDAGLKREERRLAEVQRLNADARAAMSKAEHNGSRSDFEAAQRAADRVDGALRVLEVDNP